MKKVLETALLTALISVASAQVKKPMSKSQNTKTTTATQVIRSQAGSSKPSLANGQALYNKVCITCHQRDGGGVPRLNPPLIKTDYVLGDKTRLIRIVLKGLNQPLEIEDEQYTNPMPAQAGLTDAQIADVLSYVRNSFGNKASIITAAEVKSVRARTK